jgi:hypothetical protein
MRTVGVGIDVVVIVTVIVIFVVGFVIADDWLQFQLLLFLLFACAD